MSTTSTDPNRLMPWRDAMAARGIPERLARRLVDERAVRIVKVRSRIFIRLADLDDYLDAHAEGGDK